MNKKVCFVFNDVGQTFNTACGSEWRTDGKKAGRAGEQTWRTHGRNETRGNETKAPIGWRKSSIFLLVYVTCHLKVPVHVASDDIAEIWGAAISLFYHSNKDTTSWFHMRKSFLKSISEVFFFKIKQQITDPTWHLFHDLKLCDHLDTFNFTTDSI